MINAKSILTPILPSPPLILNSSSFLFDATEYIDVVSSLQYLLITRHDIVAIVNKPSQYRHCLTTKH